MTPEVPSPEALARLLDAAARADAHPSQGTVAAETLGALFEAHRPAVLAMCRRYTPDPDRAQAHTEATLHLAWRRLGEWRGEASFMAWLFGLARFTCEASPSLRVDLLVADGVLDEDSPTAHALARMGPQHAAELLAQAAAEVASPLEHEALHLRYELGLEPGLVAALLGLAGEAEVRGVIEGCGGRLREELGRRC